MPPRLARLLAVIAALVLVGGAFAVRSAIAGDDGADDVVKAGVGSVGSRNGSSGAGLQVLCDADLGETVCGQVAALDGVVGVDVADAHEVLGTGDAEPIDLGAYDAWLTLGPMPGVLAEARRELTVPVEGSIPVASGRLVALADIRLDCAPAAWTCVMDAVSGRQQVAVPTLASSVGIVASAAMLQGLVGPSLQRDGIAAVDDEPGRRVTDLTITVYTVRDLTGRMVTERGTYQAVISPQSIAEQRSGSRPGFQVLALEPPAVVPVVLAPLHDDAADAVSTLAERISDDDDGGESVVAALAGAGWPDPPAESSGLPEPDIVYALAERLR